MLMETTLPFILALKVDEIYLDDCEMKLEKLLLHEQIKQLMIEYCSQEMDRTERPKKLWYRKEMW